MKKKYVSLVIVMICVAFATGILGGQVLASNGTPSLRIAQGDILIESGSIYLGNITISELNGLLTVNRAIQFAIGLEAPIHSEGLIYYDYADKTLTIYNDESDISLQIGQEQWVRVKKCGRCNPFRWTSSLHKWSYECCKRRISQSKFSDSK